MGGIARSQGHVPGRMLFCLAGWALAALLACAVVPRLYQRFMIRLPAVQGALWAKTLEARKAEIAAMTWNDRRPLQVLSGDSHVEMGPWYDLLGGACAVRNCGLARATIDDVTSLIVAVPDRNPETLVLMCGINNLGREDSVPSCLAAYEKLLETARSALHPQRIVVLSVMPVRESPADRRARRMNAAVAALNERLQELCRQQNAAFANVNDAVRDARGGLADHLTIDGLHLNAEGYKKVAAIVRGYLIREPGAQ